MPHILPIHEIGALPLAQRLIVPDFQRPDTDPGKFSIALASGLIDLCVAAEMGTEELAVRQEGEDLYIAFRSVGDPADLLNVRGLTDVRAVPMGTGHVYGPLAESYRELIEAKVKGLGNGQRLWMTGHGVGATYALLAAFDLIERKRIVAAVYTFGSPRIGDRAFVRSFPCPVFRVVNNLDVIVTMPTMWHWRHAGIYKLINADGSINGKPTTLNRLPSLMRQTAWLGKMLMEGLSSGFPRSLYTLLSQVLGDHTTEAYQSRLHALRRLHPD